MHFLQALASSSKSNGKRPLMFESLVLISVTDTYISFTYLYHRHVYPILHFSQQDQPKPPRRAAFEMANDKSREAINTYSKGECQDEDAAENPSAPPDGSEKPVRETLEPSQMPVKNLPSRGAAATQEREYHAQ